MHYIYTYIYIYIYIDCTALTHVYPEELSMQRSEGGRHHLFDATHCCMLSVPLSDSAETSWICTSGDQKRKKVLQQVFKPLRGRLLTKTSRKMELAKLWLTKRVAQACRESAGSVLSSSKLCGGEAVELSCQHHLLLVSGD